MTPAEFVDNPDFARDIPERKEFLRKRALPAHEDCSPIDVESAAFHLKKGGTLGSMEGYEERPGQIDMLKAIAQAFDSREHLLIEAGTGVGKSLAYLVPAILWSKTNDTSVVISTATRNLQSQLLAKDIPNALKILGDERHSFKVALLKGRTNYLCLKALGEFFESGFWTMSKSDQEEIPGFMKWFKSTEDGDLDFYNGLPRNVLTCPGEECPARHCPYYSKCFVYKARAKAAEADLVVANHSLVLADAASSAETSLLPPYSRLIMDEAHNLENIATEQLSKDFSLLSLTRILNRLDRRAKGRSLRRGGILANIARVAGRGDLRPAFAKSILELVAKYPSASTIAVNAADELMSLASALLLPGKENRICRFRCVRDDQGRNIRQHSVNGLFENYSPEIWQEADLERELVSFENALAALVNLLHSIREAFENEAGESNEGSFQDLMIQLEGAAQSIVDLANDTLFILAADNENYAFWIESAEMENRRPLSRLVAAPLYVGAELNELIYKPKDSVILSSATLRVGRDFRYMIKRLGCEDRFRALSAPSPFDYLAQSLTLAPSCLADPSVNPAEYSASLATLMKDLFSATAGRALVLFTSYEMMKTVASLARDPLERNGIRLLVQGEGLSRESITNSLRASKEKTVVFGAQSFWEGVDIAGEALSCVVITRLPFAQRTDPIIEARSEKINREGGSSFRDYYLPEAVIKFRQGFGRLIRSKQDRGVVIITDPRIATKNYGAIFRRSLPSSVHTITSQEELLERVRNFFDAQA